MKKFISPFILLFAFSSATSSFYTKANTNSVESSSMQSEQSQWIEIGEVTLVHVAFTRNHEYDKKAILYVMQLGEKFIYKIKWDGRFYSVYRVDNNSAYNAGVKIPDGILLQGGLNPKSLEGCYRFTVSQW